MNKATRIANILVNGFGFSYLWSTVSQMIQKDPEKALMLLEEVERALQEKPIIA